MALKTKKRGHQAKVSTSDSVDEVAAIKSVDEFVDAALARSMFIPVRPLDDRVLVKRDEAEDKTPGGILLPDSVKDKRMSRGTVVRVGPGKPLAPKPGIDPLLHVGHMPMPVKPGNRVMFGSYAGCDVPDYPEYVMMRADDVIAVLETKE